MPIPDITEYRIESNHRRRLIKQMKEWRWANAMDNRLEEYERRQQKKREEKEKKIREEQPEIYKKYKMYKNKNAFDRLYNPYNRKSVPDIEDIQPKAIISPHERPKSEIINTKNILNKNSINLSINSDKHV